ncbi:hypothetical protein HAZT_HAZT007885 [Hyalella azteca]|uniref:Innexin n=1 Tax=Hyalella azteca TaxID=294128 RepID=A0A6A0H4M6_HYAAZ|nr:hypothetical protein HAZT_HAZT007885 [Hyalella azteca]
MPGPRIMKELSGLSTMEIPACDLSYTKGFSSAFRHFKHRGSSTSFVFASQMFLIDRFLGGAFLTFGLDVIRFMEDDQEIRVDPMIFVFPRMTKCSFINPRMRAYLLCLRFRLINKEVINTIVRKSKMGDWFLFFMLGQNVDTLIFKEVMHELAKRLGHASKDFGE